MQRHITVVDFVLYALRAVFNFLRSSSVSRSMDLRDGIVGMVFLDEFRPDKLNGLPMLLRYRAM